MTLTRGHSTVRKKSEIDRKSRRTNGKRGGNVSMLSNAPETQRYPFTHTRAHARGRISHTRHSPHSHTHTRVDPYRDSFTHAHAHTHAHTHTHTHTHAHAHAHTPTNTHLWSCRALSSLRRGPWHSGLWRRERGKESARLVADIVFHVFRVSGERVAVQWPDADGNAPPKSLSISGASMGVKVTAVLSDFASGNTHHLT